MNEASGTIRRVAWREVFPWFILLRTVRIAISPTLLAVATLGVLLTPLGWWLAGRICLTQDQRAELAAAGAAMPSARWLLERDLPAAPRPYLPSARTAILEAYFYLAEPLRRFFQLQITLREAVYYLLGFLWTLAVWAFPGAVITRRAVVQLATDAAPGIVAESRYAARRYFWYFLAPLYPLLGLVLLALPIAIVGLFLRASLGIGALIAGLVWVLVILASLAAMWLLLGLIFGWPLMWPAISAEPDGDAFEAFSRSYSYVYGRPLHYFFYAVVAAALGALAWAVVAVAGELVQEFGFWALAWGGGREAAALVREQALDIALGEDGWHESGGAWRLGTSLIGLLIALLHALVTAFRFTYFFAAASAIYLLLRHDVDEKELDEVYVEPAAPAALGSHPIRNQS
jgi:hypothetical protein